MARSIAQSVGLSDQTRQARTRSRNDCAPVGVAGNRHGRHLHRSRSSASRRRSALGTRRAEQADADHRQPVRHDGLRPAEEPRRLRAAGALPGRRGRHRGARPRHRAVPRGGRARATTWSSRSAATAPSTRRRTGWPGPDTPLSCLPGGRTNVYCRMLGIPTDVVDATEHLLRMADDWHPRRVDLGRVNDRYFVFSAGVGPRRQRRRAGGRPSAAEGAARASGTTPGPAIDTFNRHYLFRPPRLEAELGDERGRGRHRDRPERHALHLFRRPPGRHGRGRDARRRRPGRRRAHAGQPDRHPDDHLARALQARPSRPPPPDPPLRRARRAARALARRPAAAAPGRRRLHRRGATRPRSASSRSGHHRASR